MKADAYGNFLTIKGNHLLSGLKVDEMEIGRYLQQLLLSSSVMTGLKCKLQTNDPLQGWVVELTKIMCF